MRSDEVYSSVISFVASVVCFNNCVCKWSRELLSAWQECDYRLNFHSDCKVRHPRIAVIHGFAKQGANNCLSAWTCNHVSPLHVSIIALRVSLRDSLESGHQYWNWEMRVGKLVHGYVYTIANGVAKTLNKFDCGRLCLYSKRLGLRVW